MKNTLQFLVVLCVTRFLHLSANTDILPRTKLPWHADIAPGRVACVVRCQVDAQCDRVTYFLKDGTCNGITLTMTTQDHPRETPDSRLVPFCNYVISVKSFCQHDGHCQHLEHGECHANTCRCKTGYIRKAAKSCVDPKGNHRTIQSKCGFRRQCAHLPNAECIAGKCRCKVDFNYDQKQKKCRHMRECERFKHNMDVYKHHRFPKAGVKYCFGRGFKEPLQTCFNQCWASPKCTKLCCTSRMCLLSYDFKAKMDPLQVLLLAIVVFTVTGLQSQANTRNPFSVQSRTILPWTVSVVPSPAACIVRCYIDTNCTRIRYPKTSADCGGVTMTMTARTHVIKKGRYTKQPSCNHIVKIESFCQHNGQCHHLGHAECQNNSCRCKEGSIFHDKRNTCLNPKEIFAIKTKCHYRGKCQRYLQNAECHYRKCRCRAGHSFDHWTKTCRNLRECKHFIGVNAVYKGYYVVGVGGEKCYPPDKGNSTFCVDKCNKHEGCNKVYCSSIRCTLWYDFLNYPTKTLLRKRLYQKECLW